MIHLNIGSNLDSKHGSRFINIAIAIKLLIESKVMIEKISNFYETPSYPNKNFPKFLNVGVKADYKDNYLALLEIIKLIEKKMGRLQAKKNNPRIIDIDIIDFNKKIKIRKINFTTSKCHLRNFVYTQFYKLIPIGLTQFL